MDSHKIKLFIYHHNFLADCYNVIRKKRRDKRNHLTDEEFAKIYYKEHTGRELDLIHPKTYDDKLWYLKLHNRDPLLVKCTDKYLVREYVEECGLSHILNELYAVYDSFDEIEFEKLPDRCILKCNHTSGTNAIFDRNRPFDYKYNRNEFHFWMQRNSFWSSREWNYKDIHNKIICEKVLEQPGKDCLDDYKFMCFDGQVKLVFGEIGICRLDGTHNPDSLRNIYDRNFKLKKNARFTRKNFNPELLPKPKNYQKMVEYAEILSKPFIHCRVDLYNLEGEIFFGEITFYHQGCSSKVVPEELYYQAGDWIDLSKIKFKE